MSYDKLVRIYKDYTQTYITQKSACIIAVSGGCDSMALLRIAVSEHRRDPVFSKVIAFTFDHGLRASSQSEAHQVKAWCHDMGVEHITVNWQRSIPIQTCIQERARHARYDAIMDVCHDYNAAYFMTAHHQDDQIETFLMRLFKGSGVEGLSAMHPATQYRAITHLRPFLQVPKSLVCEYMQDYPFIEDPSNTQMHFERVRIRALIQSMHKQGFDIHKIAQSIHHIQELCQGVRSHWDVQVWLKKCDHGYQFDCFEIMHMPKEHGILALRHVIGHVSDKIYPLPFKKAECVYDKLKTHVTFTLAGYIWRAHRDGDVYTLTPEHRTVRSCAASI